VGGWWSAPRATPCTCRTSAYDRGGGKRAEMIVPDTASHSDIVVGPLTPPACHCEGILRILGSLHTGAVRAHDVIRMLSHDGRPALLGDAIAHDGRIAKALHDGMEDRIGALGPVLNALVQFPGLPAAPPLPWRRRRLGPERSRRGAAPPTPRSRSGRSTALAPWQ
jgi:hypothetical protein